MIRILILLVIASMSACKPAADSARTSTPSFEPVPPVFQKIALYINQYAVGPNQGATLRPNMSLWTPSSKMKFTSSTNVVGQPPYSASLQYLGRRSDCDIYSITITHPVENGTVTFTQEIRFQGSDLEIWRDEQYRIGLRPDSEDNS